MQPKTLKDVVQKLRKKADALREQYLKDNNLPKIDAYAISQMFIRIANDIEMVFGAQIMNGSIRTASCGSDGKLLEELQLLRKQLCEAISQKGV